MAVIHSLNSKWAVIGRATPHSRKHDHSRVEGWGVRGVGGGHSCKPVAYRFTLSCWGKGFLRQSQTLEVDNNTTSVNLKIMHPLTTLVGKLKFGL